MLEHRTASGWSRARRWPSLLAAYDEVAEATDALLANPDLDLDTPPAAAGGAVVRGRARPGRRDGSFIHIVAETAQHAGHADIIRETIDGQKSMG